MLNQLAYLDISGNQGLDTTQLAGMTALNYLEYHNANISLLRLVDLPNLHRINAQNAGIREIEFTNTPDLYHFQLWGNQFSDVTSFAEQLKALPNNNNWWLEVYVGGSKITDPSPFGEVTRLGQLDLQRNAIKDISSLATLTNLWNLNLRENQITKVRGVFDNYRTDTWIGLNNNPILCSELDYLEGFSRIEFDTSCATDSDDDGVADGYDAFPDDPAASVDNDGDGQPDEWNEGYTSSDTGLVLDDDDDNDTVSDAEDPFPNDPTESVDSDGDGVGDNSDAYPNDASRQYLPFDEALAGITDTNLKQCIESQAAGAETAGDITYLDCNCLLYTSPSPRD